MTKYPLITKLGLSFDGLPPHYVRADELEQILASAPVATGSYIDGYFISATIQREGYDTHQARVVMIEPVQCDTADVLLKQLLGEVLPPEQMADWLKRARRVVGNPE